MPTRCSTTSAAGRRTRRSSSWRSSSARLRARDPSRVPEVWLLIVARAYGSTRARRRPDPVELRPGARSGGRGRRRRLRRGRGRGRRLRRGGGRGGRRRRGGGRRGGGRLRRRRGGGG